MRKMSILAAFVLMVCSLAITLPQLVKAQDESNCKGYACDYWGNCTTGTGCTGCDMENICIKE
jgi:hypothetical protein